MVVKPAPPVIVVSDVQPSKAELPMDVTFAPTSTLTTLVLLLKALEPMLVTLCATSSPSLTVVMVAGMMRCPALVTSSLTLTNWVTVAAPVPEYE